VGGLTRLMIAFLLGPDAGNIARRATLDIAIDSDSI
jgi:hypothetical protein